MQRTATVAAALLSLLATALSGASIRAAEEVRWYVYRDADSKENHGHWTNWMPKEAAKMIKLSLVDKKDPHTGSTCVRVDVKLMEPNWCGIAVTCEPDYWGDKPSNAAYDLRKAKKLVFHARGARGGESIQVKVAITGQDLRHGVPIDGKPVINEFGDSARIPAATELIELTQGWKKYELDLTGYDLSRVVTPFVFVVNQGWGRNWGRNFPGPTFFLDDIYIVLDSRDDQKVKTAPKVTVAVDETLGVQMTTKGSVTRAEMLDRIARVVAVRGDPTRVLVTGVAPGVTRLKLTDKDDRVEEVVVIVREVLRLPAGGVTRLELPQGLVPSKVEMADATLARVSFVGPRTVQIEALRKAGNCRLILTGVDGRVRRYDVEVCPVDVMLTVGQQRRLEMNRGGWVAAAWNSTPRVGRIQAVAGDPTAMQFVALSPGVTRVTMADESGSKCDITVGVTDKKDGK